MGYLKEKGQAFHKLFIYVAKTTEISLVLPRSGIAVKGVEGQGSWIEDRSRLVQGDGQIGIQ